MKSSSLTEGDGSGHVLLCTPHAGLKLSPAIWGTKGADMPFSADTVAAQDLKVSGGFRKNATVCLPHMVYSVVACRPELEPCHFGHSGSRL